MAFLDLFQKVCEKNGWPCEGNRAEISVEGGRSQRVFVETFDHEGKNMARAYSNVGSSESLAAPRLEAALSINYGLPHGALAIHEGHLVMTDTFLEKDADEDEVESSIHFIARSADRYERLIFKTDAH